MIDHETASKIINSIEAKRCTDLAVTLVDVPSPTGNERPIAECIDRLLDGMGIQSQLQEFEPERYQHDRAYPRARATARRCCSTATWTISFSGNEAYLPKAPGYKPKAVVKDGWIYGMGVHNMKGGCAASLAAAEAVVRSGVELKGTCC